MTKSITPPNKTASILTNGDRMTILVSEYPEGSQRIELSNNAFALVEEAILKNLAQKNPEIAKQLTLVDVIEQIEQFNRLSVMS